MNTFAGNITLKTGKIDIEKHDFDIVAAGNKTYFIMGEIDINTSKELLEYFTEMFGELECWDVSISTEDQIEIFGESYDEGVYEVVSFEGAEIDFDNIASRFEEVEEVCVVRSAEESGKFKNKIIKVDFLY